MLKLICRFIFRLQGWTLDDQLPPEIKRCLVLAAPHTSNWDFWYTMAAFAQYGIKIRFTVKKEWMRFPFSLIMKPLGAIPIDRSPQSNGQRPSATEAMAQLFAEQEELVLVITPEGSRSLRKEWKTGFYYVAEAAQVPILLGYVDYAKKKAGIGGMVQPTTIEKTLEQVMAFYSKISPKFPAKFSVDNRYHSTP
jgi:1-acyl-sn-glycerol-3-phosphate acyltransferase